MACQHPWPPPIHLFLCPKSPPLTLSTFFSTPSPTLDFLSFSQACLENQSLTWLSLRWGRRLRLPGRSQLRPVPPGPDPSGRTLRSLSSSSPCGPGNSPGFWLQQRWLPDHPGGCLEYRRLAWSRRSPENGAGLFFFVSFFNSWWRLVHEIQAILYTLISHKQSVIIGLLFFKVLLH